MVAMTFMRARKLKSLKLSPFTHCLADHKIVGQYHYQFIPMLSFLLICACHLYHYNISPYLFPYKYYANAPSPFNVMTNFCND